MPIVPRWGVDETKHLPIRTGFLLEKKMVSGGLKNRPYQQHDAATKLILFETNNLRYRKQTRLWVQYNVTDKVTDIDILISVKLEIDSNSTV